MDQLAPSPIGGIHSFDPHQPPSDLARDQRLARCPQHIENQARALPRPEPSVTAADSLGRNVRRLEFRSEQPKHGVQVDQISAGLPEALFQVSDLTGQLSALGAQGADNVKFGHSLSP
jgi:hypothetical protein